jgi:heavy metal efflux system protein
MKKLILISAIICKICGLEAYSQEKIDLKTATTTALKNNLSLNNERLKTNYANALIQTYKNVPITNFLGDFGQVNSAYFDTRIGVSQTLKLPKTYNSQKALFSEEMKASQINESIKEADLKRIIQQIFSNYLVLNEKLMLLQKTDSVYQVLLQKANLRLQKGESNILEKNTFEIQKNSLEVQISQIQNEMNVWLSHLKLILNTDQLYIPSEYFKLTKMLKSDSLNIENNPNLIFLAQNIKIAKANTSVEQSKLLPELLVGYNNGSFRGVGANEKLYNSANRFHSVQFGVGIPLFKGYQKAKINASKINETIAENSLKIEKEAINNQLLLAYNQQEANAKIVTDYEKTAFVNINLVSEIALKQLNNGEINYLDYIQLINQNIGIQLNYFDAVKLLNESTIQLNYILNK